MALIGLLALAVFNMFVRDIERSFQEDIEAIAQSKRTHIQHYLEERHADAGYFAMREKVWRFLDVPTGVSPFPVALQQLNNAAQNLRDSYHYRDVRLLDARLNTVFTLQGDSLSADQLAAIKVAADTRSSTLVDLYVSKEGSVSFGVAAPVFAQGDAAKRLLGVVYLESNASHGLFAQISEWPLHSVSGEALLLRREGEDEILYLTPLRFEPAAAPLSVRRSMKRDRLLIGVQAIKAQQMIAVHGNDYIGMPVLAAATPVPGTNWVLVAKVSHSVVSAPIKKIGIGILIVLLLIVTLVAIAARLLWLKGKAEHAANQLKLDARYRAARQASMDAYTVMDESAHILEVNAAAERLTGYTKEELLHMNLRDINAALTPAQIAKEIEKIRQAGGDRLRTQWRRKDGTIVDVEVSATYLGNANGGTVHSFVHNVSSELAAERRIERLNAFNVFLSHVNAAIFNLRNMQEILEVVCDGAVRDGGFVLAWAGVLDEAAGRVIPTAAYGEASEYVKNLLITTDPALPTSHGPTRMSMMEQRIHYTEDFLSDSSTGPWHEIAKNNGINSSAAVPLVVNGKAIAALCFYSREKNYFDAEFRNLLEEAARNISLAMETASALNARNLAQNAFGQSERRFQQALDASPIPVQLYALDTRQLRFINAAHQKIFGYSAAELQHESDWFEKVYPDPLFHTQIREQWEADIQRATNDRVAIASPELSLRCKDGSVRIVRGFMSVAGDDIIVQWEDMTDIKHAQAELIENERRFRSMIEQTLTGIYVTQNNEIVYANPRLSEITGWSREELLGKDSLDIFARLPESRQQVIEARAQLHSGTRSVALQIPYHCRDGKDIVLGIHASLGVWDGQAATIVMLQDITERQHAEEKIAAYVRQLEGTMRGTLQAVANMVEMRDPYTAGHERRVGLIAADIAREMGWPEEKCQNLQLIGLVHDIGKIAVPAEILSKPGRLTPLEYQMIQAHAERGYEILKNVEFPLPIAEIIREHHERADGSGYPQGLKGEQILPEARILAVADVLESMASHRPYRPALGLDAAINEIESHRITWFDPLVVDAMLRLVREKGYQLPG